MKKILIICCLNVVTATAQMTFVHPGALNNKEELDFIKLKIKAGTLPWTKAFNDIKKYAIGGVSPLIHINSCTQGSAALLDAQKAYANALYWYFTNKKIYARQAIDLLNGWSGLQSFNCGSDQDKLLAGWIGALWAPAAEIMKSYKRWRPAAIKKLKAMFKRAYYPQLNIASSWNGNVDLTQIDAIMSIAVFNEDATEFNLGVERFKKRILSYFYLASDGGVLPINGDGGDVNSFWNHPAKWVDGLTQETCRDNNHHAQYAMASALHAAETAWHQGVDLYTPNTKRFTDVMELMALQLLTGSMLGTCNNNKTTTDLYNTWEVGYNHYHFRMGIIMPNTEKLIKEKVRVYSVSDWNIFFETLTHTHQE